MSPTEVVLAVDVGTTAAKAIAVDREGRVVARGKADYAITTGPAGRVEQSPEDWWRGACKALRTCLKQGLEVVCLGLTGQMQDLILTAGERTLGPAILYSDQRAAAEAAEVLRNVPMERWVDTSGNLLDAGSLPPKLLWLKRNDRHRYREADGLLLGAHDYVAWRACGTKTTDTTNASTTGLMNLETNAWADDLLDSLELRTDWFPELRPAHEIIGSVSGEAAEDLGIPKGTPVCHGAGDAATTSVGVGAEKTGEVYLYLGTSGWLAVSAPGYRADPYSGIFTLRHPSPDQTILIGPMLTASGALEWSRKVLLGGMGYERVERLAPAAPPGCGGLLFLPYLAGERSPFRDPDARGAFIGLGTDTSAAEIARSVMEGVAFAFRGIGEAMPGGYGSGSQKPLPVVGGGSQSDSWCQILANVMARPVTRHPDNLEDVAARGAAIIAGQGLGWDRTEAYAHGDISGGETFEPSANIVPVYAEMQEIFRDLYRPLSPFYGRLATLRRNFQEQNNARETTESTNRKEMTKEV